MNRCWVIFWVHYLHSVCPHDRQHKTYLNKLINQFFNESIIQFLWVVATKLVLITNRHKTKQTWNVTFERSLCFFTQILFSFLPTCINLSSCTIVHVVRSWALMYSRRENIFRVNLPSFNEQSRLTIYQNSVCELHYTVKVINT